MAKDAGLDLSPATIRNVMADLEDLGFVASPHTSAGRVPTVSGYRMFVDSLLSLKQIDKALLQEVQQQLDIHDGELMPTLELDPRVSAAFRGGTEDQEEDMAFLERAMLMALAIMAIILVTQFNSIYQAGLILTAVLF